MKIPEDVLEILESPSNIKMIAFVDDERNLSLDPVEAVKVIDESIIAIGCYCGEDSRIENVKKNKPVTLALFEPDMIGFQLKGRIEGTDDGGALSNRFEESGIVRTFKIRVTEIYALTMAVAGERVA